MKIEKSDINSLRFAITLLSSIADQTLIESKKKGLLIHRDKVRKIYLIILIAMSEKPFDFSSNINREMNDLSPAVKGIKSLCPLSEENLPANDTESIDRCPPQ